jgi:hypothetical protein
MSTDLHDLFADAYRAVPPSTVDADLVVRRGRRVRARRQAVTGTGALLGVSVVVAGSVAFVATATHGTTGAVGTVAGTGPSPSGIDPGFTGTSARPGDPSATPSPTPSDASPVDSPPGLIDSSMSPSPWKSGDPTPTPSGMPSSVEVGLNLETKPAGIDSVGLPTPAPGFPLRRWVDDVSPTTLRDPGTSYYVATFGLAKTPYATLPGSPGSQVPTGPEVTIFVGDFPLSPAAVAASDANARVAGATGYLVSGSDKGTPTHDLYFSSGTWSIEIHGFGGVTTAELVALGNALTGIR